MGNVVDFPEQPDELVNLFGKLTNAITVMNRSELMMYAATIKAVQRLQTAICWLVVIVVAQFIGSLAWWLAQ